LERILRRIKLKKLHPLELDYLNTSLESIMEIFKQAKFKKIATPQNLYDECEELVNILQSTFILDACAKYRKEQINENLFLRGIHPQIDKIEDLKLKNYQTIE
jgi:DNA mismatch repair protein MutS